MKLRQLESYLQQVEDFESPKLHLEQYATSAHIASQMLYTMHQTFDDIKNNIVADYGCGCGVLSLGCGMLDAGHVISIDIDTDSLGTAQHNLNSFELLPKVDLINCDIVNNDAAIEYLGKRKIVDVVVMNPPFGTKNNKGIDMKFLYNAIKVAQDAVYSLHKTSTRDHIIKKANEWGCDIQILAELKYNLPKTYRFHKKQSMDVFVDFIRCEPQE